MHALHLVVPSGQNLQIHTFPTGRVKPKKPLQADMELNVKDRMKFLALLDAFQ